MTTVPIFPASGKHVLRKKGVPEIQHRRRHRQSFFFFFGHRIELQRRDLGIPIFFPASLSSDRLTLVSGSDSFHKLDANVANSFCPYFEGGIDCCYTVGYNKDAKEKC